MVKSRWHKPIKLFGMVGLELQKHRGGTKPRKGPYNKSREMQRRVRQQAL